MTTNPSSPLVLIVEDDSTLNEAYQAILKTENYDVVAAENGQEALAFLKETKKKPAVILLDLRMPVLDGIGFLKEFDAPAHPETTVVVFSNYDARGEVDEAYKLGADRYVLKARAAPKELLRLVASIMEEKEQAIA